KRAAACRGAPRLANGCSRLPACVSGTQESPCKEEMMRRLSFALIAACVAAWCGPADAQDYPNKPVRIVAPFAPGGSADTLGRLIAERLSETLKQQFFVENRAGAGGVIGSQAVASSPPDGYNLVISGIAS